MRAVADNEAIRGVFRTSGERRHKSIWTGVLRGTDTKHRIMELRSEALGEFSCDICAFRRATFVRSRKRYVCHQI